MKLPQWVNHILYGGFQCKIGKHDWRLLRTWTSFNDPGSGRHYEVSCGRCGKTTKDLIVLIMVNILNRLLEFQP